jgi:hydrogenase-4 component E
MNTTDGNTLLLNLNALVGSLFLLCAFGMTATRQVLGCLRFYVAQALLLATSAVLLSLLFHSWHLTAVAVINLLIKPVGVPAVLRRITPDEVYTRREIVQALNITRSLLIALGLVFGAWFLARSLLTAWEVRPAATNLPIGIAGLFLGALTISVRREALPQFLGMLAMENGAFFAGIAIVPTLPLFAELAVAFDVLILTLVISVLTRTIHERVGTTAVGHLTSLKEAPKE